MEAQGGHSKATIVRNHSFDVRSRLALDMIDDIARCYNSSSS